MSKKQYRVVLVVATVAGLVGGVVSSWFLVGSPVFAQKTSEHAKVVRAERFELVDKNAIPVANLGLNSGGPTLQLLDKDGKLRAALALVDGEPGLIFQDREGKQRVLLFTIDGEPRLKLFDKNEETRAILGYTELALPTGSTEKRAVSSLVLFDKDGKVLWAVP